MHLTLHADYSLRVLLYLVENPDRFVSTAEISRAYGISRHHLVRVVHTLHTNGFLQVSEGRSGGAKLLRKASEVRLGDVIRKAEPGFRMVECFDLETNTCPIVARCRLRKVLGEALDSFFAVLDGYTLADLARSKPLVELLQIGHPAR
ncbi:Rrf2 family transcriptional regulator [Bryobacterales bacterium F-183]|nr:Rrf2 family transcriptional regulator [Bryobacterales bacterium F-183]